ncbi:RES family NAD+ phosphorylase [Niabella beijingensis]|uniref:RES family NAD+ phosphorylase n=1 Tax=Niabella beijingensis TaxID=2872700 RepID=UPI001CC14409|nr:RES family NAD+ phosphorylase [Niabella beijingensis]MBZ4188212.1 RES family NAD+ phosphorylase [Niabella beijingensis]
MLVYRLVNAPYREDISGYGAFLFGGRWNSKGVYALYTSEHISLAALEIVVNFDRGLYKMLLNYYLLTLDVPESPGVQIQLNVLKDKWAEDMEYTRFMGDQFLLHRSHLVLRMPSAVIPEECNLLLNPQHSDFKKVKIVESRPYGLDNRLFK